MLWFADYTRRFNASQYIEVRPAKWVFILPLLAWMLFATGYLLQLPVVAILAVALMALFFFAAVGVRYQGYGFHDDEWAIVCPDGKHLDKAACRRYDRVRRAGHRQFLLTGRASWPQDEHGNIVF